MRAPGAPFVAAKSAVSSAGVVAVTMMASARVCMKLVELAVAPGPLTNRESDTPWFTSAAPPGTKTTVSDAPPASAPIAAE